MACRAFTAINVDTSDLGNVPEMLRHILEATLSQEASVESLEKYLPRIRDIIINLLQGLKRKQQKLRQKQSSKGDKDGAGSSGADRVTSTGTAGSNSSNLTNMLDEGIENGGYNAPAAPPRRGDSIPGTMSNMSNSSPNRHMQRGQSQSQGSTASQAEQSSRPSNVAQQFPVQPPYPGDEVTIPSNNNEFSIDSFPPPPPPPKPQSALAALERGGALERRASRRYSQYQVSKLLGGTNGVPMLPTQTGPIPNRGRREMRESMQAVQSREDRQNRSVPKQPKMEPSPARTLNKPGETPSQSATEPPTPEPETKVTQEIASNVPEENSYRTSATLTGPIEDLPVFSENREESPKRPQTRERKEPPEPQSTPPPEKRDTAFSSPAQSPPLTKDLTLFLQYKSKVKKIVLPEGFNELSIGRLQLAFIEKFSWNTQQNGADLPEIYIQDPVSGIRHELEDLSDIKDRTVLVLNVEALDEVKRHIDDGLGSIRQMVEEMKQGMMDQGSVIQRVSDRQQETAKEVAKLASVPPTMISEPIPTTRSSTGSAQPSRKMSISHLNEFSSLRRDLAVLRQTYSNFQSDIQGSMSALRTKANNVKALTSKMLIPDVEGGSGSKYVSDGRKKMNADSDTLVGKVDDLQDQVEDLRKDVVHRGVRPRPTQLEVVTKDIALANKELKKMEDYIKKEKPIWTKIWEKELEEVCQGRDELRLMEDLIVDLKDDLEKASETFGLVEQATKEQMKDTGPDAVGAVAGGKQFAKGLSNLGGVENVAEARDDVLGQVRALQPNHENRLEAIERAERQRKKDLESRKENPLHRDLVNFVEEGKLKKSGGVEEVERARKAKDERIRREVWERQNGIVSVDSAEDVPDNRESSLDMPGQASPPPSQQQKQQHSPTYKESYAGDDIVAGIEGAQVA